MKVKCLRNDQISLVALIIKLSYHYYLLLKPLEAPIANFPERCMDSVLGEYHEVVDWPFVSFDVSLGLICDGELCYEVVQFRNLSLFSIWD